MINKAQSSRLFPKKGRSGYYMLQAMRKAMTYAVNKYSPVCDRGTILDYGCGCSPYQSLFEPYFDEYKRADIASAEDIAIKLNNDGTVPLEEGSCNAVVSTQVLEHVNDVDVYLSECNRVLRSNGLLFISTHGYWKYHPSPTDYWRWTRDGLIKKLKSHGFKEVETLGLISPEASGIQLFSIHYENKFRGSIKRLFRRFTHSIMWLFDRYRLDNNDAGVYVCIMQKCAVQPDS
ncbi:class I SAM-dependent methyltransferase [Lentisphaerota bacterium ZTH]|nr:class I SAM-dependent methyltransferase [Lentisphaerota bacterium]WET05587.1 class I SAM-dependent methyltransferase [Lentisphaerota bacterium ZTH]